jgi:hypothetical protein
MQIMKNVHMLPLIGACTLALLLVSWGIIPPALGAQGPQAISSPDTDEFPDAQAAEASDTFSVGSLGSSNVNVIDGWFIRCPSGTHHVHFDLSDHSSGGPTLGVVAVDSETGASAVRRAPQGGTSTAGQVNGGMGTYYLYVFKTGGTTSSGANYTSLQVCHTSNHGFLHHISRGSFQDQ